MRTLQTRIDRLDGGHVRGDVQDMSDAQLWRLIARVAPDPAAFLDRLRKAPADEVESILHRILDGVPNG